MVTVIERRSGERRTTCNNCASVLEYMPTEVFREKRNQDYLGDFDLVSVITCPVCNSTTKVNPY